MVAGIAGLVAGAMSMAAGEYVSVSSQSDTELADLARERRELESQPEAELDELMQAYIDRGLNFGIGAGGGNTADLTRCSGGTCP
ncbi:VIT family [Brucella anthropi]|nr:VIT family [Brucella anthropi]